MKLERYEIVLEWDERLWEMQDSHIGVHSISLWEMQESMNLLWTILVYSMPIKYPQKLLWILFEAICGPRKVLLSITFCSYSPILCPASIKFLERKHPSKGSDGEYNEQLDEFLAGVYSFL